VPDIADDLNQIVNPRLAVGRTTVTGWRWLGDADASSWSREGALNGDAPIMTVRSQNLTGSAAWARRARCKPGEHYRIEMVVSCDCRPADDRAGLLLIVQPLIGDQPAGAPAELAAPNKLDGPSTLRAYYHAPKGVRSVEIRVGLFRAKGQARIHEVLMLPILEPEAKSHVQAAPPPPYAYPPPKRVKTICVCTEENGGDGRTAPRPMVDLLRRRFGARSVRTVSPRRYGIDSLDADAVILPDSKPPPAVARLSSLYRMAEGRVVVLSLPAFARIAGPACQIRTVEQPDDPIHAKVRFANFITVGFAIADSFPYAWRGRDRRNFVQRQFRRSPAFREFCERHGFETVLLSECETDATSDRSVCVYKPTEGGAIVVLDIDPAESVPTNFDEPDLALYLLLNVLGRSQTSLGQYVAPARSEKELRDEIAEVGTRFAAFAVRGDDHPDRSRQDQFVEVGAGNESYGLPVAPRPLILIRSGLRGDDHDSVYGTLLWLKNLVRTGRFACPYAEELLARFRLAWVPLCAEWHAGQGWRRPAEPAPIETAGEFEPRTIAALIDVAATRRRQVRVVVADGTARRRYAELLPELARRLTNGRFFYRSVPADRSIHERHTMDWRIQQIEPRVVLDEAAFDSDLHRNAAAAGATLIRLEFPGPAADLSTGSIWRTDLVATTIEHVIGLQYGWLAANRYGTPVRITPPAPSTGAKARFLKVADGELVARTETIPPGKPVLLQPGAALGFAAR